MKKILLILCLTSLTALGQFAAPTYNPFNNRGIMPPQYQRPNYGLQQPQFFPQQQFQRPNNFTLGRPNVNYGFQNNFQRPQQQYSPQQNFQRPQQQYSPQQNWQAQPYQPSIPQQPNITAPQRPQQPQTNNVPLFTRRFHLNNGYLYGRPTLYYDPKTNRMQPWVRKNLR